MILKLEITQITILTCSLDENISYTTKLQQILVLHGKIVDLKKYKSKYSETSVNSIKLLIKL